MSEKSFGGKVLEIRDYLEKNRHKLFGAAADGVDADRYTELAMQAIGKQSVKADPGKRLIDCSLQSIGLAVSESASLGLPIGSVMGHGHLVPYRGAAQFQAGYLGIVKLAYQSPLVAAIRAEVVYEQDDLHVRLGTEPSIVHRPSGVVGPIKWVYAILWLENGPPQCEVWSHAKIEAHRRAYVRGRSDAWSGSWDAMAKKTVALRVLKFAPLSDTARHVIQRDEYHEAGVETDELRSGDDAPTDDLDKSADELVAAGAELFGDAPSQEGDTDG